MVKTKSAKGKSKKITWKKIRHPDVEDFLDEQRREERLGISDKSNEDLFFLDQLGFDDDYNDLSRRKKEAENKRNLRNKDGPLVNLEDLRCFQILKPDSQVKDPVIKRNPLKKGGLKKTPEMQAKDDQRYFQQSRKKTKRLVRDKRTKRQIRISDSKDLWADDLSPADAKQNQILSNEWLTDNTKRNLLRNRTTYNPNRKTNEIKPIEAPHPGLSYNPSYKDHQEILVQTVEAEKEKIKKDKKLQRAIAVPRNVPGPDVPELELEIKSEPESDGEKEFEDDKSKLKLIKPKTRQQKRKEKEEKEKQMKHQQKKEHAMKEAEVYRVKSLKKQIDLRNKTTQLRLQKRVENKLKRDKFGVKVLSRVKFQDVKTQPLLSTELPKGLINSGGSCTTGDLLLDRFKSLQKRNVIEPTVRQKQKLKHKLKKYQRDSEKMEWEKTGKWNGEKVLIPSGRRRPRPRKQQ